MRIGFDVRMIENSGIGVSIRGILDNLADDRLRQMTLFGPGGWPNPYSTAYRPAEEKIYGLAQHFFYGGRLNHEGLDVFHMPHYDAPLRYRGKLVVTIHDLIHVLF